MAWRLYHYDFYFKNFVSTALNYLHALNLKVFAREQVELLKQKDYLSLFSYVSACRIMVIRKPGNRNGIFSIQFQQRPTFP